LNLYPTLSQIALDVLPAQASSDPCEQLFSAAKQVVDDWRSRLGAERFEQLQMLKFTWRQEKVDFAAWNSGYVEQVDIEEFVELLRVDEDKEALDGIEEAETVEGGNM
jgi:hypothetical protein